MIRKLFATDDNAATAILTLAICIGANTAIFTIVNSVLLKPLPYPDSDRLVSLWLQAPGAGMADFAEGLLMSPSMYLAFSEHNRSFTSMGIWSARIANVTGKYVHSTPDLLVDMVEPAP